MISLNHSLSQSDVISNLIKYFKSSETGVKARQNKCGLECEHTNTPYYDIIDALSDLKKRH